MIEQKNVPNWNKDIATKVKEMVRMSGLTRWKIAQEIGIAEGSFNNLLNGQHMPSLPVLKLLSQVLGDKGPELLELVGLKDRAS